MTATAVRDDFPKLEKYELLEEIGHGGMATVYRARDLRLGREVAVKIIHRHLRDNREVATRFIAEGRAAAKLKHRGIVEVYDVSDEEERERYLVAELVRGVTLRQVLVDHREMPAEVGAALVIELCEALDHAHASGIIHRDIKPENVLVSLPAAREKADSVPPTASGARVSDSPTSSPSVVPSSKPPRSGSGDGVVIKITDFGIAKILDAQGVTSTGQVLGSPAHMAPEQIEGGEVCPRTDVFALGVVLYEALVGHLPFEGKNPAQVLRRVLDGKYERAESERPTIGARFSTIVDRSLALDPKDRPETPSALAALLREELEALGLSEPHRELEAYFKSPEQYSAKLKAKLVPTLVARGEAARRERRVAEAGKDFNRAHALAPDDLHILKRMTQLSSASKSSKLPKRLALVALVSVGLGGAAYAGVRLLKNNPTLEPNSTVAMTNEVKPDRPFASTAFPFLHVKRASADPAIRTSGSAASSAPPDVSTSEVRTPIPTATHSASAPSSGERMVQFNTTPWTASVTVDGNPVTRGTPVSMKVGTHKIMITMAAGDTSCDPWTEPRSFAVTERADGDPEVQPISMGLSWKPATVTLVGAPAGASARCGTVVLIPDTPVTVKMTKSEFSFGCEYISGGTKVAGPSLAVSAGGKKAHPWPR